MDKPSSPTPEAIEQRKLGVRLATEHNATAALKAIKDPRSSHGDILRAAVQDVGADTLADILATHHPEWAFFALKEVPEMARHEDALLARANEFTATSGADTSGLAAEAAVGIGNVGVNLVWGSVMYTCYFTMMWNSAPNVTQPSATQPNSSKWVWSPKMDITYHSSYQYRCDHFAIPGAAPSPGDPIWIRVAINAGVTRDVGRGQGQYVYQPGGKTLTIDAGGTTQDPSFTEKVTG